MPLCWTVPALSFPRSHQRFHPLLVLGLQLMPYNAHLEGS